MLFNLAVVLLVLWMAGLFAGYAIGAFVHVLLVTAIVLFFVGILRRRPTSTKFPAR